MSCDGATLPSSVSLKTKSAFPRTNASQAPSGDHATEWPWASCSSSVGEPVAFVSRTRSAPPENHAIFDPSGDQSKPLTGAVAGPSTIASADPPSEGTE
jgi:hypothetical protein